MIYLFLAEGFEEIEALTPVDYLRRAGIIVTTVGVGAKNITGAHNITVAADITTQELPENADFDGVILPGGMPGTLNLEKDTTVMHFVNRAYNENKLLCAICAAPSVLGHAGILNGKKATCFPGFEEDLTGAVATGAPVEKDGNIITARGAGVAADFAFAIIAACKDQETADKICRQIQSK
ncbi:MAG: DJ-1/PfpI family protein [Ruminococcaceae bacterium]|nr:DJ-1/PfpI family protein [Oscillospiraceae bacterium]